MNSKEVAADFQILGNRVVKLTIETKIPDKPGGAELSFDMDYKSDNVDQNDNQFIGMVQLAIQVRAKIKNKPLFKIDLLMEGVFAGNSGKISREKFIEMMEMNGLITLIHISRAYLTSISAQSGINPPIHLPMVNVVKWREVKRQTAKNNKKPKP